MHRALPMSHGEGAGAKHGLARRTVAHRHLDRHRQLGGLGVHVVRVHRDHQQGGDARLLLQPAASTVTSPPSCMLSSLTMRGNH
jgi:hypothetical protein